MAEIRALIVRTDRRLADIFVKEKDLEEGISFEHRKHTYHINDEDVFVSTVGRQNYTTYLYKEGIPKPIPPTFDNLKTVGLGSAEQNVIGKRRLYRLIANLQDDKQDKMLFWAVVANLCLSAYIWLLVKGMPEKVVEILAGG